MNLASYFSFLTGDQPLRYVQTESGSEKSKTCGEKQKKQSEKTAQTKLKSVKNRQRVKVFVPSGRRLG